MKKLAKPNPDLIALPIYNSTGFAVARTLNGLPVYSEILLVAKPHADIALAASHPDFAMAQGFGAALTEELYSPASAALVAE